ncbi:MULTISPECIES: ABC transporter ATP-binding protein [Allobacillus]|uniref:ABC transporter ATP-binding protein n=1 Tax=Allobacillus halotolerans TaxID=570278 RepID=A0ABS6GP32_9BACI|nr:MULTISPECIES: ABC transporter ATP-binding protein [Allobacillus]MBU6080869.1 ABC transporter ATP-binding protein [Allobacillus halotolerans]TSJ65037.1 ABC transporter ATP-binding protein [Allobacillus sp. SKP2-8]
MEKVVDIKRVTKKFGDFKALDEVDFSVRKGEVFGFIGPNGAGKSTTIRILLGILKATEGQATIFGKDVWNDSMEIHRQIAYVPGDVNLWPNLTGGEVIDLFAKLRGGRQTKRREELLERYKLDPTKKCRTYSKGNRQKVALVSALLSEADLYIFDEPTSGLDPLMEQTFQEDVRNLRQEGKSVLLSSHILSEVEKLCDRVGIIRDGTIIEQGSLEELRHLTRHHVLLETTSSLDGLRDVEGVHDVNQDGNTYRFQVNAEQMDQVIKFASQYPIQKFESAPPTLEDLFMRHYEGTDEVVE